MKVSIIVAAYNIEDYIKRCMYSIVNQTFKDIEIIVVNDGSTDNTLNIINDFAKNDARIKIIDKKNGGLIEARKSGLEIASGEYILFLDGDDWLHLEAIEKLYQEAKKDNFDIVEVKIIKAKLDKDGRKVTEKATSKNNKTFDKVVKEEKIEKRQKDHPSRLHARRQIMKKIYKRSSEDVLDKLFNEIAPKQDGRVGGYTRIVKMEPRKGDAAEMAVLEILM